MYIKDRDGDIIKKIFYKDELDKITSNKIQVNFIDDNIYSDDTIETVKFKLLKYIGKYSYEELYMYGFTNYNIDKKAIYNDLTNNNKNVLTKLLFSNFLNNIGRQDLIDQLPIKDSYTLEDIYKLSLGEDDSMLIKTAIGQKFVINEKEISYVIDPFTTITIDPILDKYSQDIISTSNKNLLLEYEVVNNIIYFVLLEDIESIASETIPITSLIKIYYPYLHNDDINDFETYILNKSKYYSKTEKIINSPIFNQYNSSISLFYKLSDNKEIDYNTIGIKNI